MMLAQMVEIGEMVELVAFHRSEQWLHDVSELVDSLEDDSQKNWVFQKLRKSLKEQLRRR